MRTVIRVLLYDVLLGLVYIGFDAYLAWWYFSQGHKWWGALTLGAVALPGTLGGSYTTDEWNITTIEGKPFHGSRRGIFI